MKKVIVVLQARKNSLRLPGKVLKPLQGIPVLSHCMRRLKNIDSAAPLVVATSILPQNDGIAQVANDEGAFCYRGSEEDVLDRIYRAASRFKADFIVRATGDNPLVDSEEAKRVLEEILSGQWDYVCGFKEVAGLVPPVGVAVEAFSLEALEYVWRNGKKPEYREHINDYIFDNNKQFRTKYLSCLPCNHCPDLRLTVDTINDFRFIERIGREIKTPLQNCATREIIDWWRSRKTTVCKDDLYKSRC